MTALAASARRGAGRSKPGWSRMAWITWRQHRMALAGVAVLLGGCSLGLGIAGLRIRRAHEALAASRCNFASALVTSHCGQLQNAYYRAGYPLTSNVQFLTIGLLGIPLLIGVFIGAPLLAREYEAGTNRFAWTQAVGRTRWMIAKFALLGAALTAATCMFGVLVSWWLLLADAVNGSDRWQASQFGLSAVTFAAWTLLAFATGALAGALIRRTVPAMAATGICVAALMLATFRKLDPLLTSIGPVIRHAMLTNAVPYAVASPPVTFVSGVVAVTSVPPGSWPLRSWITSPRGRVIGELPNRVLNLRPAAQNRWLTDHHLRLLTAYQPAWRFWVFQGIEGGAALLLAVLLGAATVWLVRRRAA